MRKQLADLGAALAMLGKGVDRFADPLVLPRRHSGLTLTLEEIGTQFLPVEFAEQRFVIEQFKLRRRATLKEIDDSFRLGGKVRKSSQSSESSGGVVLIGRGWFGQHRRQGDRSDEYPGRDSQRLP